MPTPKSQLQIYREVERKIANLNEAFMDLVREGLTREDLEMLIEKRPELYERFSNFLNVLPRRVDATEPARLCTRNQKVFGP